MKILLDTHTFLWWITDDDRLSKRARKLIADGKNEVFLSAVSVWEIAIKSQLGRLELSDKPSKLIPKQISVNGFIQLPITAPHTLFITELPVHHADPFDRLLVAQAHLEQMSIITKDSFIKKYPVKVIW